MEIKKKLKELFSHFFIYGIGSVAQSAVTFLLLPLLTNNLSTNSFGVFSLIQMCSTIASTIFYLGISSALSRSYFDYDSEDERRIVFSTSFYLVLLGALLQMLLGWAAKDYLSVYLFSSSLWGNHIFLALTGSAIGFANQLFFTYMRFVRWSKLVSLTGVLTLLLNIGASYFFLIKLNLAVMAPILGALISNLVVFLFLVYMCRNAIGIKIFRKEIIVLLKFGLPNMIASIAAMIMEWSDRFLLNKNLSVADVGIYTLGYRAASVISILLIAPFVQVWNPIMMENRKTDSSGPLFTKVVTYYFLSGVVVIIGCALFFVEFLYVIIPKNNYYEGIQIAPIVMLGMLINGLNNIVSAGLFYERKMQFLIYVYCISAILNFALSAIFIPYYGYGGAAWCSFATYCFVPVLTYYYAKKFFAITFEKRKLAKILLLGLFVVSIVRYLDIIPTGLRLVIKSLLFIFFSWVIWVFIVEKSEKNFVKKSFSDRLRVNK